MTHRTPVLAAVVFLILAACEKSPVGPGSPSIDPLLIRGFSYTSFTSDGFQRGHQSGAVDDLLGQTACGWLALSVFEYQSTATSHDIAPGTTGMNPLDGSPWPTTATLTDLTAAVADARRNGLKIMLKPHVDLYSGEWRAAIRPDSAWFASYRQMILKYAHFAADHGIEILCIGVEYVVATQPAFTASWISLIASIDSVYNGSLTYAANWSGAYAQGITTPEYLHVGFWSKLDYVGIDMYYPLTYSRDEAIPSFTTAFARLAASLQQVGSFMSSIGMPMIITEIGIQSVQGALAEPWNYSIGSSAGAVEDDAVQELYYRVILESFGRQIWCRGIFWWNWESVVSLNERTNYTPRNKPAAAILRLRYANQPS